MKTVNSKSTKAEEIQFLREVAQACESGSYLADLFSEDLLAWVERQIGSDGCPDLIGLADTEAKRVIEAQSETNSKTATIKQMEREAKYAAIKAEDAVRALNAEIEKMKASAQRKQEELERYGARINALVSNSAKAEKQIAELKASNEALEIELLKVKAATYDALMSK